MDTPTSYRHRLPIQLRWTDYDMLGHVNNNAYLSFLDLGKAQYFLTVTGGKLDMDSVGLAVVNINADFCAQTRLGEELAVETACTAIGEKSVRLEQRVVSADGQVKCTCRTVMAAFSRKEATSVPVTEAWIEALENYEQHPLRRS